MVLGSIKSFGNPWFTIVLLGCWIFTMLSGDFVEWYGNPWFAYTAAGTGICMLVKAARPKWLYP